MTQKHTPTPWQDDKDGDIVCPDQNYEIIAHAFDMYGDSVDAKTNAAFIVRACNSHAALVEALEDLFNCCMAEIDEDGECINEGFSSNSALGKAKAALALAKGE